MKSHHIGARAALAVTFCAAALASQASAEQTSWTFSTGADYTHGDYGTGQDTDILTTPFSVTYGAERWRVGVAIAYVSIEGGGGVVPSAAGAIAGAAPLSSVTNPLFGPTGPAQTSAIAPHVDEQGLGDATVEVAFTPFIGEHGTRVSVQGGARLATGDEERSLGAGETVLSLATGVAQPISNATAIYGAIGYSTAPDGGDDGLFLGAGLEGRIANGVLLGASAEWSQAQIADAPERTQATLYAGFDLTQNVRMAAYVLGGLSDAAPDVGAGLRLTLH
jgi:hypothetical protein